MQESEFPTLHPGPYLDHRAIINPRMHVQKSFPTSILEHKEVLLSSQNSVLGSEIWKSRLRPLIRLESPQSDSVSPDFRTTNGSVCVRFQRPAGRVGLACP